MKWLSILMATATVMAVLTAYAQTAEPTAIPVKGDAPTSLYGGGAASRDDCVRKQAGDSFHWKGSGQMTWKVQVDRAGDYEVALNHAAEPGAVGQHVQVSSGGSRVEYTMAKTKGVFGDKSYEMTPIKDRLRLEAGTQSIALSIPDAPKAMDVLNFRSLELIPVAAKAAIEADRQEARRARASTEWMAKAGYGLMFHWTSQSIGRDGTHKPYAQAVDDFDVKHFAEMVEETGAGYVIFTIGHAQSYCPATAQAWEKYYPGKTTKRDLIAELADALERERHQADVLLERGQSHRIPEGRRRGVHPDHDRGRDGVRRALQGKGSRLLVRRLLSSQRKIPWLLLSRVLQVAKRGIRIASLR